MITHHSSDGVMVITLANPQCGNSITARFFAEFSAALGEAEADSSVRVVLTVAEGSNFCVGADAANLPSYASRSLDQIYRDDFKGKIGVVANDDADIGTGIWARALFDFPKPLICAVNGAAAGGGFAVALLHHVRICDAEARFTTAFARLGIGPELGMSTTLANAVGEARALEMLLSARMIDATEAKDTGLVSRVTADQELRNYAVDYARRIAASSPQALASIIDGQRTRHRESLLRSLKTEWSEQRRLFASPDFRQAVTAFTDARLTTAGATTKG